MAQNRVEQMHEQRPFPGRDVRWGRNFPRRVGSARQAAQFVSPQPNDSINCERNALFGFKTKRNESNRMEWNGLKTFIRMNWIDSSRCLRHQRHRIRAAPSAAHIVYKEATSDSPIGKFRLPGGHVCVIEHFWFRILCKFTREYTSVYVTSTLRALWWACKPTPTWGGHWPVLRQFRVLMDTFYKLTFKALQISFYYYIFCLG